MEIGNESTKNNNINNILFDSYKMFEYQYRQLLKYNKNIYLEGIV